MTAPTAQGWPARYHVCQVVFLRRAVHELPRGTRVKVHSLRASNGVWRYRVTPLAGDDLEDEHFFWAFEHELSRTPPGA